MDSMHHTIKAAIRPGEKSGYVSECWEIAVVTPEEVERDRDEVGTIIKPALREGKVLYERPA